MKFPIIILLIVFISQVHSQTYETRKVIAKADSTLKAVSGDYLYQFFKYDSTTYYEYTTKRNRKKWENLIKKPTTKGTFKNTFVRFNFRHPAYPWIHNFAGVQLDSSLNLSDSIDLRFIPRFLVEQKESNYISKEHAIEIAKKFPLKEAINEIEARLIYNLFNIEGYSWLVSNYFDHNQTELVIIEPVTGKVLQHYNSYYGPLHGSKSNDR